MKPPERTPKPLQFACLTLPWKQLPDFPDIGSWKTNADNSPAFIGAADTGNDVSNAAILIHEIVESLLCWIHKIPESAVSEFDKLWFYEEAMGKHGADDEPGYDPRAPYRDWHLVAEKIEREFIIQCGMQWQHHVENCKSVYDGKTN